MQGEVHVTWHEGLTLALELVKVIAWPVLILVLVFVLKPVLVALLVNRNWEFKGFGIVATVRAIEQQQATTPDNPVTAAPIAPFVPQPAPDPNSPALASMEQRIQELVAAIPPADRQAQLVRALAISRLLASHEFVYNRIFGSQIEGLKRLDEIGSISVEAARDFFRPYAEKFPQLYTNYPFENWLGFMLTSGLVRRDGDQLFPTEFGHAFLVYLREVRLTEAKAW